MQTRLKWDRGFFFVQVPEPKFDISADNADELMKNKLQRDGKEWHITIITSNEFNKIVVPFYIKQHSLTRKDAEKVARFAIIERFNHEIQSNPKELGLGKVEVGNNVAYFVVIDWKEIQNFRKSFELDKKDLHITVAFGEDGDIHGVPKDKSSIISPLNENIKTFITKVIKTHK